MNFHDNKVRRIMAIIIIVIIVAMIATTILPYLVQKKSDCQGQKEIGVEDRWRRVGLAALKVEKEKIE